MQQSDTADVIVVGGGGSGLAAAVEAASLGRSVILLERHEILGGSTARSIGSISATNTPHQLRDGIRDRPDDHFEDMGLLCKRVAVEDNLELRRILVDNVSETVRWLMSWGVEFLGPLPEHPHRKPRMHNVLPNSRAYIYHLERAARRLGVDIRTGVRARHLIIKDNIATGVVCDGPAGSNEFHARGGIVLTTGDYSANPEMKAKYISKAHEIVQPVNPYNEGDGHLMVLESGGRIVHPQLQHGGIRFQPPPPNWISKLPPYRWLMRCVNLAMHHLPGWLLRPFIMSFVTSILVPSPRLFGAGALLVNKHGQRFDDERHYGGGPYPKPKPNLASQPDGFGYILFDRTLADMFSKWPNYLSTAPGVAYAYIPDYRRNRKDIFREAQSWGDLARKIDIPAAVLEKTVADYNAAPLQNADGTSRPQLLKPPFVAMGPVRFYMNFTDGGVAVNNRLEVLGEGDKPIAGLYAAGFTGMGGVLLEGHGHHLGWAFTSGRIAGRSAAYRVVSEDMPVKNVH